MRIQAQQESLHNDNNDGDFRQVAARGSASSRPSLEEILKVTRQEEESDLGERIRTKKE